MLGISSGLMYGDSVFPSSIIGTGIATKLDGEHGGSGYDTAWMSFGDCLDVGTSDFSISCWFKKDLFLNNSGVEQKTDYLFVKRGTSDSLYLYLTSGRIRFVAHYGGSYKINTTTVVTEFIDGQFVQTFNMDQVPNDQWVHFCVSVDRSANLVLYYNGLPTTNFSTTDISSASSTNFDNDGHWKIGTIDGLGVLPHDYAIPRRYYDEYGLFNTALDADNVAAIYNNGTPLNLLIDSGDYDQSSALQGYWKFGDGVNDIKYPEAVSIRGDYEDEPPGGNSWVKPVIRDQTSTSFGSELWDATQPSTSSWTASGNNTVEVDDGAIKISYVDDQTGAKALFSLSLIHI